MSVLAGAVKPKPKAKPKSQTSPSGPLLELNRNYSIPDGAAAAGVAAITLWRAIYSSNLQTYRVGRRRVVSGQQIKEWLESGGKTSGKGGGDQ